MKKPSYSVTINYIKDHNVESISLTGEAAEAVNAQAHNGQDLRFVYNGNNVVIPWEAVVGVQIYKTMEDVTAPTDAICGGAVSSTLEVTFYEELECSLNSDEAPCNVLIQPDDFVNTMTFDGEDIKDAWFNAYNANPQSAADVVGGTYDAAEQMWLVTVPCDAESVEVTIVYKVPDASASYTLTLLIYDGGLS